MTRLTKKNDKGLGSWTQLGDQYVPAHNIKHKQCVNKLGQLEDIEEELGIDLITLFKALKDGIYVNGEKEHVLLFYDMDFFNKTSFQLHASNGINYYFKDYGKTWTLTKEELECQ